MALEAIFVVLLLPFCLKILAFNTLITSVAERVIELVVMALAKWIILHDIESCCFKWLLASLANKA
jgi:hypothetical protein